MSMPFNLNFFHFYILIKQMDGMTQNSHKMNDASIN